MADNLYPITLREPALRLELQQRVPDDQDAGDRPVHPTIERELTASLGLATTFARMHETGRISRAVTYADFIAIAEVAREWAGQDWARVPASIQEGK